jgi:hypothetical protein
MSTSIEAVRNERGSLFRSWVSFDQLERRLYSCDIGLALQLYPPSAPSSTVGGWLAQGRTGYERLLIWEEGR